MRVVADDLFDESADQAEIDFQNEGGETYICGNPPYLGSTWQSGEQKDDLKAIFGYRCKTWKSLDYVAGWFMKAADYGTHTQSTAAFVSTNSICQGQQVPILWPLIFATGNTITFAHTSFKWANLASHNAGVTVAIVALSKQAGSVCRLFSVTDEGSTLEKQTDFINAYLVAGADVVVEKTATPICLSYSMSNGNKPTDGGGLILDKDEARNLVAQDKRVVPFIKKYLGADEVINGKARACLWIPDEYAQEAASIPEIANRLEQVRKSRLASTKMQTIELAARPHQFEYRSYCRSSLTISVPAITSENREYLPVDLADDLTVFSNKCYLLYDAPLWNMALIASRLHWVWIGTVCVRLEMRFSYSNTLGWNTFPVPPLTEKNKADLTRCAENILLAREHHFPATIADLYDPANMPDDLRAAHEHNDEVLERIYIGRRFKNDTERLEKLFDLYTKMTAAAPVKGKRGRKTRDH